MWKTTKEQRENWLGSAIAYGIIGWAVWCAIDVFGAMAGALLARGCGVQAG
jgi:hypothetical protein